jgi:hypothetical protein
MTGQTIMRELRAYMVWTDDSGEVGLMTTETIGRQAFKDAARMA